MADYIRNLAADIINKTTVDNNVKLITGAGPPMTADAPDADIFGSVINQWTEMNGNQIWVAWPAKNNLTVTENGGKLEFNQGVGVAQSLIGMRRNNISYLDCDIVWYWNKTDARNVTGHVGPLFVYLWRVLDNLVLMSYEAVEDSGSHALNTYKIINGAATLLNVIVNIGVEADMWFRIKRIAATQTFTFWYAINNPVAKYGGNPANWIQTFTGIVNDATHFNSGHVLYPIMAVQMQGNKFDAEADYYEQTVGSEERYWPDDPICNIIDSDAGAVEYAYDAGAGNIWSLTGASCTKTEPGTSTVKFRIGWSDNGLFAGVTWVDAVPQVIAQIDANAAAGLYDNHRYLHVETTFTSDGTDQPSLTDFTISDVAIPPPSAEYNLDEVTNNLDEILLS